MEPIILPVLGDVTKGSATVNTDVLHGFPWYFHSPSPNLPTCILIENKSLYMIYVNQFLDFKIDVNLRKRAFIALKSVRFLGHCSSKCKVQADHRGILLQDKS